MKKSVKILLRIFLDLALIAAAILITFEINSKSKSETFRLDISQFSGRIIPADKIKPGTFTINVPISEALQYGKDAILSYGEEGIKIWKPDDSTSGVFLYSAILSSNTSQKVYKVFLADKEIMLNSYAPIEFIIFLSAMLCLVIVLNFIALIFTINELKS
ncbi:hypothetical protein COY54_00890 [Candidatus Falkowbacteria bacterium CG_4_10_14_0_8_um_filter_41_36]|uniref:Uncharacterized protein n=1 Tax=Candidatus Falkowbacteria bacterium CG_4_10_14_0_8_um_filter_41_36 TaxID=1974556 RepID=A0A2M7RZ60_9BACT|nr:MAG: hypothetical protein COY54_00890 [Candidatus Falkowbacteria bacterium CG_4_10_14_0_8_um_filter_41_36]